jgi:hypothetical protein
MSDTALYALQRKRGINSRYAGLGFLVISIGLLVFSVYDQLVIVEFDSIIAFIAGIVLLFRDPQARVPASVFDATVSSSDQTLRELAATTGVGFSYVPTGNSVAEVVLIPTQADSPDVPNGRSWTSSSTLTPPGLGLAELYRREARLKTITMDALKGTMSEMLREDFGLASSTELVEEGSIVRVVMHKPSGSCTCAEYPSKTNGWIGCTVASFLAVLVSTATKRSVLLDKCVQDSKAQTWTVTMNLGPKVEASE